jgi:hypothetical protein
MKIIDILRLGVVLTIVFLAGFLAGGYFTQKHGTTEIVSVSSVTPYYRPEVYEIFQRDARIGSMPVVLLRNTANGEIIPLLTYVAQGSMSDQNLDTAAYVRVIGYNAENMSAKEIQFIHSGKPHPRA